MKKRIFSFLLLLCLLLTAMPTFALPSAASEGAGANAGGEKITVTFRLANSREAGENGTLVAERRVDAGFSSFALPSEAECYAAGVNPTEIIGWYSTDPKGNITDARAYSGVALTEDLLFYPILKTSAFSLLDAENVPFFTREITHTEGSTRYYTLLGLRGGFNVGYTERDAQFVGFERVPSSWLAAAPSSDPWTWGGAYYSAYTATGDNALILSASASRTVGINWTAVADGTVDLDFSNLTFLNGAQGTATVETPTAYLALVKNGEVIWPQGASYATTAYAANGWYKATVTTDGSAGRYSLKIEDGVLRDLAVTGGDSFTLCIGYSNIKPVNVRFVASYKTVGEFSEKLITSLPAYTVPSVYSASQLPALKSPSATEPEVSVGGLWDWITYQNYAAVSAGRADEIAYYSPSGATKDAFLTSVKDYGSDTAVPAGFKYGLPVSSWGDTYSITVQNNGSITGIIGFRYTAEYTGRADLAFSSFLRTSLGWENSSACIRVAVFVDGVMVWPTSSGDAANLENWYAPFPNGVENPAAGVRSADIAAALSESMPKDLYVVKGQKIEFLMTAAPDTNIWSGAGTFMEPAVAYSTAYVTDFSASATLGERFALNFTASLEAPCFTPTAEKTYLDADSFQITVTDTADGMTVGKTETGNGKVRLTVSGIAARMLTDAVSYKVTVAEQNPNGTKNTVTLASGKLSVADYLTDLAESGTAAVADLANATLAYGREAQLYFGYRTDNLPAAGALSFTPAAMADVAAETEGGAYRFTGATLLLADALTLKFFIDATDAPLTGDLYLAVAETGEKIPLVLREGCTDGRYYKGYLAVPYANFATAYTLSVVDGAGKTVSAVLRYSVGSYVARMQNGSAHTALLSAIGALGRATETYQKLAGPTPRGNTVSRVVILSDAHIGETLTNASAKLRATLAQIGEMGGADAILFLGDMTDSGSDKQYEELVSILNDEAFSGVYDRIGLVLGNHEYYRAGYKTTANTEAEKAAVIEAYNRHLSGFMTEELGFYTANGGLDHTLVLNGVYYIGIGERDCTGLYGAEAEDYLCEQVEAAAQADPTKPIFVYSHLGYGEIAGDSKMTVSAETAAFLANYPQIVWLTGHTHYAAQDALMIQQGDFTNIQCPTSGSKYWWYYSSYDSENYAHPSAYATEAQQGLVLEVTDTGVVVAQRYDFATGENIGSEWVIDIPAMIRSTENFAYTVAGRLNAAAAPAWGENDRLAVTEVTSSSATVTLPRAHIADSVSDDTVTYYRLVAVDEEGNAVCSKRIMSEYYRGSAQAQTYTFLLEGLEAGKAYRLYAVAESVFGILSAALEGSFTTSG